jgi:ADP-dependent NAD(P)H-hydrate dehydratase
MTATIDARWCSDHPLPPLRIGLDKEARGTVLVIGGSEMVPGATLLTGQAALRVGAGKVQIGTIAPATVSIGTAFPEVAVIALPIGDDGEIAVAANDRIDDHALDCSVLVIGPGMAASEALSALVGVLLGRIGDDVPVLLDAGAIPALATLSVSRGRTVIITPHHGELAKLMECDIGVIDGDPGKAAQDAADRFGVTVVLKDAETVVVAPDGERLRYASQAVGLGTAGSGDVLAGAIAGLLARGCAPLTAIGWGVRAHGEAGRLAGTEIAPIGYLARELLPHLPRLICAPA